MPVKLLTDLQGQDPALAPPPSGWGQRLLALLFPPRCAFCGSRDSGLATCEGCADALRQLRLPSDLSGLLPSDSWLAGVTAVWRYEGLARQALLALKFYGNAWRAPEFGRQLCVAARNAALPPPDLVLPVPDSRRSARQKPYSVPLLLARALASAFACPLVEGVLVKRYDTAAQHRLSRLRRRGNPVGAYTVADPAALRGKTVWLVDDIVTTGATLRECARVLWLYGARQVVCLCLCATPPDRNDRKK